jgi:hypothetical protein
VDHALPLGVDAVMGVEAYEPIDRRLADKKMGSPICICRPPWRCPG